MPKPKNTGTMSDNDNHESPPNAAPLSMEPQTITMKRETAENIDARTELYSFGSSAATPTSQTPKAADAGPDSILNNDLKIAYDGGKTILPHGLEWQFAWKPSRGKRDMEPLVAEADDAEYKEDMIIFEDADGRPAVLGSAEEVMMLVTSIPGPHHLFEPERYFVFPSGSEIKWEDATFYKCGSVKFEQNASKLMEDTKLGTEFWLTIAAMATCGSFSNVSEKYDIRGLRITRKKAVVVEFWLGHKDRQFVEDKQKDGLADVVDNITTDDLNAFLNATREFIEAEMPGIKADRWSTQKFFNEE